jgi:hypothetical protein
MKALQIIPFILVLTVTTCFAGPSAAAQVTNKTFEKTISITTKEIRIDSLLKTFSRQTGAEFSFNSNKISPSRKLTVTRPRQTLSQWLDVLRENMNVQHKIMGNHIILVEKADHTATPQKNKAQTTAPSKTTAKKTGNTKASTLTKPIRIQPGQAQATPVNQEKAASPAIDTVTKIPADVIKTEAPRPAPKPAAPTKPDSTNQLQKTNVPAKPVPQTPVSQTEEKPTAIRDLNNKEAFQGMIGYSKHGSGDMTGIVFGASYTRYLTKKFSLNYDLRGTINYDKHEYEYIHQPSGTRTDASVRFTTAGVQLGVNAQLSVVRSLQHEVIISLGAFGRYQSASNGSDGYSAYPPGATGMPAYLIGYDNRTQQNTFAAGGLLQFQYNFTFRNNLFAGVVGGLQTDTNGELIPQAGLTIGRRF